MPAEHAHDVRAWLERRVDAQSVTEVSLAEEERLLEREIREDDTDYLDRIDAGRTVRELILETGGDDAELIEKLALVRVAESEFRVLSTGERRRLMLARALAKQAEVFWLEDVFDGVDVQFRDVLRGIFSELKVGGKELYFVSTRMADLQGLVDGVAVMKDGYLTVSARESKTGARAAILRDVDEDFIQRSAREQLECSAPEVVVDLQNVTVSYGGRVILDQLTWTVRRGESWQISGPNGCGKSTIVGLITGDCAQCFSNDVEVFGMKRGGGESIWDVKSRIGLVSSALQQSYRASSTLLEMVVSGHFDSIGVYEQAGREQIEGALGWLQFFDLAQRADAAISSLTHAERRLGLIARALVKSPDLLILDEPCQALGEAERSRVLRAVEKLIAIGSMQLIYISHETADVVAGIDRELRWDDGIWRERKLAT